MPRTRPPVTPDASGCLGRLGPQPGDRGGGRACAGRCPGCGRGPPCAGTGRGTGRPSPRRADSASSPPSIASSTTAASASPSTASRPARRVVAECGGRCRRREHQHRIAPVARVEPDRRRLAEQLVRVEQRGQPGRDRLDQRVGALLGLLDLLPVAHDVARGLGLDRTEDVGVAAHELVVDAPGDVGRRELARPPRRGRRGTRPGTAGHRARRRDRRRPAVGGSVGPARRRRAGPRSRRRPRRPPPAGSG